MMSSSAGCRDAQPAERAAGPRRDPASRRAENLDASWAVAAGGWSCCRKRSDDAPLQFPLEVEGDKVEGRGTLLYQSILEPQPRRAATEHAADDQGDDRSIGGGPPTAAPAATATGGFRPATYVGPLNTLTPAQRQAVIKARRDESARQRPAATRHNALARVPPGAAGAVRPCDDASAKTAIRLATTHGSFADMAAVIKTVNLTKRYGTLVALSNLNLEINEGDCFGFIGPNGAGKTTTIKILATLLQPTWGEARICDHVVGYQSRQIRPLIGYVPDYFGAYEDMVVQEYMEFFAAAYNINGPARTKVGQRRAGADGPGVQEGRRQWTAFARHEAAIAHRPRARARSRRCCCSTSRPATSTRARESKCASCSRSSAAWARRS
jgi:ABC-2 type transport system ATP-binding protein